MKIQIIGQIVGTSGYSKHCRELANALSKVADVKLKTMIPQGFEKELTDKELMMIKSEIKPEYNIIIDLPINWKLHTEKCKNIGFLVWEGDRLPKSFIEEIENPDIDLIFVPSSHTKQAILNTYDCKKKIEIVKHGVNLDNYFSKKKPEIFTFIVNKGFRNLEDRGGTQYAVRAFLQEFKKGEARMLVKINPAYGMGDLKEQFRQLGLTRDSAEVQAMGGTIKEEEMFKIYNEGHVFVSPTRAEGYNLPCIEAMACGLPVITTDFGGQTDYCNNSNGWIIGGELTEVTWDLIYEGIKWLTPDITQLRKAMREAYTYQKEDKKIEALKTAKSNTWDITAQEVIKILGVSEE